VVIPKQLRLQIICTGPPDEGTFFPIGIADPARRYRVRKKEDNCGCNCYKKETADRKMIDWRERPGTYT
jgi:hypothetical protein